MKYYKMNKTVYQKKKQNKTCPPFVLFLGQEKPAYSKIGEWWV